MLSLEAFLRRSALAGLRHVNLEVQISWQAQHFVSLKVQSSCQEHFVKLEVQTSWQAQHLVNLDVQILWQAQHFEPPSATVSTNHHPITTHHHHDLSGPQCV